MLQQITQNSRVRDMLGYGLGGALIGSGIQLTKYAGYTLASVPRNAWENMGVSAAVGGLMPLYFPVAEKAYRLYEDGASNFPRRNRGINRIKDAGKMLPLGLATGLEFSGLEYLGNHLVPIFTNLPHFSNDTMTRYFIERPLEGAAVLAAPALVALGVNHVDQIGKGVASVGRAYLNANRRLYNFAKDRVSNRLTPRWGQGVGKVVGNIAGVDAIAGAHLGAYVAGRLAGFW